MLILLDQDAVIADFYPAFVHRWNQIGGHPEISVEMITEYEMGELLGNPELVDAIICERGFFLDLDPVPGAIDAVHGIVAAGHDVMICTAPKIDNRWCVPEKQEWIKRHLGDRFLSRTIFSNDKTLVRGDILIDDKPVITGLATPQWQHVFFDAPYNRHLAGPRLCSWADWQTIIPDLDSLPAELTHAYQG